MTKGKSGPGQGTSVGNEITDEIDDYWKGTIWQRIAQYRQIFYQTNSPYFVKTERFPHIILCLSIVNLPLIKKISQHLAD